MTSPSWVERFAAELREDAERRRALWPDDPLAAALPELARRLEERARDYQLETLSLEAAAEESGYSYSHLQRMVAEGAIENVGAPGSPRIRRSSLPHKAGQGLRLGAEPGDLADMILARRAR